MRAHPRGETSSPATKGAANGRGRAKGSVVLDQVVALSSAAPDAVCRNRVVLVALRKVWKHVGKRAVCVRRCGQKIEEATVGTAVGPRSAAEQAPSAKRAVLMPVARVSAARAVVRRKEPAGRRAEVNRRGSTRAPFSFSLVSAWITPRRLARASLQRGRHRARKGHAHAPRGRRASVGRRPGPSAGCPGKTARWASPGGRCRQRRVRASVRMWSPWEGGERRIGSGSSLVCADVAIAMFERCSRRRRPRVVVHVLLHVH